MNIVIDDGNTRTKIAVYNSDGKEVSEQIFQSPIMLRDYLQVRSFENALVSSVKGQADEILTWIRAAGQKIQLTADVPLPIKIKYKTPATLGLDRVAAAAGAMVLFPNQDCLVIDAGTCITYEFVNSSGEYEGGAISPGVRMRFEAMHNLTAKLPLVKAVTIAPLIGSGTEECLQSGVMNGIAEEIKGIIDRYRSQFKDLQVVLCGGDAGFFENIAKPSIFVAPNLVLHGLKGILIHNVSL
jgi:type III pantothenate kinase